MTRTNRLNATFARLPIRRAAPFLLASLAAKRAFSNSQSLFP
jgi:hypothetical protein